MTLFPWWAAMVVLVLLSTTTTVHAKVDVGYPSTPLTQCGGPTQLQWSGITGQPTVYVVTGECLGRVLDGYRLNQGLRHSMAATLMQLYSICPPHRRQCGCC